MAAAAPGVCAVAEAIPVAAGAQTGPAPAGSQLILPLPRYPLGSIQSMEVADRALTDAKSAQMEQEKAFVARRQACYGLLVAEPCLRRAIEDNVRAERHIRAVEVEARAFRRNQGERDAAAVRSAKRSRDAEADARKQAEGTRAISQQHQHMERNAAGLRDVEAAAGERARRAERERKRGGSRQAARVNKDAEQRSGAAERTERARAHEAKVKEVLQRAAEKEARARENAARIPPAPGVPSGAVPPPPDAAHSSGGSNGAGQGKS